jgi:hypothetical protein
MPGGFTTAPGAGGAGPQPVAMAHVMPGSALASPVRSVCELPTVHAWDWLASDRIPEVAPLGHWPGFAKIKAQGFCTYFRSQVGISHTNP